MVILKDCSHGMIATVIYLSQLMGFNGIVTVAQLHSYPVELIRCDKKIAVAIVPFEQLFLTHIYVPRNVA